MKVPQSLRDIIEAAESVVYVEDLSSKHGLLQTINPLVKLVTIVFMIVASLFIFNLTFLLVLCCIPLIFAVTSRIPIKQFLLRTALIPLFSAIIVLPGIVYGLTVAYMNNLNLTIAYGLLTPNLVFIVRVWFCVATLITFVLSTGFEKILKLLASLRVPTVVVQLFSLTYRYLFISINETRSVLIGKEARTYVHKKTFNLQSLKDLGHILSALFIRTYERSERVYLAMKARGFELNNEAKMKMPAFRVRDAFFAASIIVAFALLALI